MGSAYSDGWLQSTTDVGEWYDIDDQLESRAWSAKGACTDSALMDEREQAWDELHAATPPGWYVGRPSYHNERNEWLLYAFDPVRAGRGGAEKPGVGSQGRLRGCRRARNGAMPA